MWDFSTLNEASSSSWTGEAVSEKEVGTPVGGSFLPGGKKRTSLLPRSYDVMRNCTKRGLWLRFVCHQVLLVDAVSAGVAFIPLPGHLLSSAYENTHHIDPCDVIRSTAWCGKFFSNSLSHFFFLHLPLWIFYFLPKKLRLFFIFFTLAFNLSLSFFSGKCLEKAWLSWISGCGGAGVEISQAHFFVDSLNFSRPYFVSWLFGDYYLFRISENSKMGSEESKLVVLIV